MDIKHNVRLDLDQVDNDMWFTATTKTVLMNHLYYFSISVVNYDEFRFWTNYTIWIEKEKKKFAWNYNDDLMYPKTVLTMPVFAEN